MNGSSRMLMHSASNCHKAGMCCSHLHVKRVLGLSLFPPPGKDRCSCRIAPGKSCVFKVACLCGPCRTAPCDLTLPRLSKPQVLVVTRGVSQACFRFFPQLEKTLLHDGCGERYSGLERVGRQNKSPYRMASKHPKYRGLFGFFFSTRETRCSVVERSP